MRYLQIMGTVFKSISIDLVLTLCLLVSSADILYKQFGRKSDRTEHVYLDLLIFPDIKPENLLIGTNDVLKLCDFGKFECSNVDVAMNQSEEISEKQMYFWHSREPK